MKNIFQPKFGSKAQKSVLKLGFLHFLKFGALVFLEIAYNHSLQQSQTTSKGKTHQKIFGAQIWVK